MNEQQPKRATSVDFWVALSSAFLGGLGVYLVSRTMAPKPTVIFVKEGQGDDQREDADSES